MKKTLLLSLIFSLLFLTNSCNKVDYVQIDEDIIQQYISDNNLSAEPTGSGLYYVIDVPGTGDNPTLNSNVTVAYTGSLTNGTIFDQSSASGITFPLSL